MLLVQNAISANNYGGATLVRMPNPMHLLIGSANKYEKATLVQKLGQPIKARYH
jgi:hypothetical protein